MIIMKWSGFWQKKPGYLKEDVYELINLLASS